MKAKGIEPIVAAVLLVVLAVVGAVLLYLWFAGYLTKVTSQAEQTLVTEKLSIEAANLTYASKRGTYAYLYIRNLGGSNVTLATAYLLAPGTTNPLCVTNSITVYNGLSTTASTVSTLYPGQDQLVYVNFGTSCTVQSGYSYVIKIVTQQGTQFSVTITAS